MKCQLCFVTFLFVHWLSAWSGFIVQLIKPGLVFDWLFKKSFGLQFAGSWPFLNWPSLTNNDSLSNKSARKIDFFQFLNISRKKIFTQQILYFTKKELNKFSFLSSEDAKKPISFFFAATEKERKERERMNQKMIFDE